MKLGLLTISTSVLGILLDLSGTRSWTSVYVGEAKGDKYDLLEIGRHDITGILNQEHTSILSRAPLLYCSLGCVVLKTIRCRVTYQN